jgi:hypothetical protein
MDAGQPEHSRWRDDGAGGYRHPRAHPRHQLGADPRHHDEATDEWQVREAAAQRNRIPALNIRRRPRMSPDRPPSSSSPPNVTAYPVTTHSRPRQP